MELRFAMTCRTLLMVRAPSKSATGIVCLELCSERDAIQCIDYGMLVLHVQLSPCYAPAQHHLVILLTAASLSCGCLLACLNADVYK